MKTDDPSYVLAIDNLTGKTRWRVERPTDAVNESPDAYTTPALLSYQGKEEIVISNGDYVTGHDPSTGAELWRAGGLNPGKDRAYRIVASPVVADGKLFVTSEDGITTVLAAGPEFKVLAENNLDDYTLSTPAISDGQIFLRTQKHLYCIGKRTIQLGK